MTTPLGVGPLGYAPVADPSAPPPVPQSFVAALFDPFTGDYTLDSSGRVTDIHPVDQKVALRLSIRKDSLGSYTGFGSTLRDIKRLETKNTVALVRSAVRTALQDLVDAKQIDLEDISVSYNSRGQLNVVVSYRNLLLVASNTATVVVLCLYPRQTPSRSTAGTKS